jgi:hypothetical protein
MVLPTKRLVEGPSVPQQGHSASVALAIVHAERVQDDVMVVLVQWMSYVPEDDPW